MKNLNKKFVIVSIVVALIVVSIITVSSYAYFSIANGTGNENVITSGNMALRLTDGAKITTGNMIPGEYLEKEFSVENTGNVASAYDIYLSEVINNFADKTDFVYEIISIDGGYNTPSQIQLPSTSTKIVNQQTILPNATHHYKLKITFLNKNENQNDNQGKTFSAKIQVNEYQDIDTTVNYYLDNVLVNTMPTQVSSNYLSSSCDKNGTITFDTTYWTYTTNIVKNNTTCNIYFETTTVIVTYNAGEGSINPTSEEVQYGNTLTLPIPTAPAGYSFAGWYTGANGQGTKITNSTPITSNQTINAYYVQTVYEYDYVTTGVNKEQTFTVPVSGTYKLEVWGAQGYSYNTTYIGGYGGYSVGVVNINKDINSVIYVNVGQNGYGGCESNVNYGSSYNGGGEFKHADTSSNACGNGGYTYCSGTGGGASHISLVSGELKNLSSYKDTGGTNISNEILIVAGGGGGAEKSIGACTCAAGGWSGGSGGGFESNKGQEQNLNGNVSYNATQTSGYQFGLGGTQFEGANYLYGPTGGGGWYGGNMNGGCAGAGGGSGYIASSRLISSNGITKKMVCYQCTTSNNTETKTESNNCHNSTATVDCAKEGHGYARITFISAN